jgi:predicted nucleotidyltransferase
MAEFPFDFEALKSFCVEHEVAMLGAFSAVETWEDDEDVDIYVRFAKSQGLVVAVTLERHLRAILGHEAHVVMEESMTPHMRQRILKDLEVLYTAP